MSTAACKYNEIKVNIVCIIMLSAHLCLLPYNMRERDILVGKKGNMFFHNLKKESGNPLASMELSAKW